MKIATGRFARRRVWGLVVPFLLGTVAAWVVPRFEIYERQTWDARFQRRGTVTVPEDVVLVAIDERTVEYPPWKNEPMVMWGSHYADAVRNLARAGVSVIGFDLIQRVSTEDLARKLGRDLPWDQAFAQVLAETQKTVMVIVRKETSWVAPTKQLLYANGLDNVGVANFTEGRAADADGVVRGFKPGWESDDEVVPSFAVRILEKHLDVKARYGPDVVEIGKVRAPVHRDGTLLINYVGPPLTFRRFSLHDIAEGRMPHDFDFRGKIVLIGESYAGLQDLHLTPFSRGAPANLQHMPGVEVWANAVWTLLHERFITTTGLTTGRALVVAVALGSGAAFLASGILVGALICVLAMLAYYLVGCALFQRYDYLLLTFVPLGLLPVNYGLIAVYRFFTEEREKREIKALWGRYHNPAIVEHILQNPESQGLGGTRATITVLFSDVRGFTAMTERLPPMQVVRILNDYFSAMSAIIEKEGGIVDKYVGDAIMAVWGVPFPQPEGPKRAVRAAVEMLRTLEALNKRWQAEGVLAGQRELSIGVGINTGEAVFGNIGSPQKMDITVIGDTVNVASRLESLTKEYEVPIIIGDATYRELGGEFPTRHLPAVAVRGKGEPLDVYAVIVEQSNGSPAEGPGTEGA